MNDRSLAGMSEVMRLTRSGRLQEATSAIQRMLGGQPAAPAATEAVKRAETAPIEGVFRVIREEPLRASPRPRPLPMGARSSQSPGALHARGRKRSYR